MASSVITPWRRTEVVTHTQLLLESYERLLNRALMPTKENADDNADAAYHAPFVLVSHGTEANPVLNYGNRQALELWQLSWPEFTRTPSRQTAEPVHRDERAQLLERVTRDGYIDDYSGIRITSDGRRFRILRAVVWNLVDDSGEYRGQAATFSDWEWLDK